MNIKNGRVFKFAKYTAVSAVFAASLSACVPQDDQALYTNSLVMFQQGQQEQAYENLMGLCSRFPQDPKFCTDAENFRKHIYESKMSFVREKLGQTGLLPFIVISQSEASLKSAEKYVTDTTEVIRFKARAEEHKKATAQAISSAKERADKEFRAGSYFESYDTIDSVRNLDVQNLAPLAAQYSQSISEALKPSLDEMAAQDKWKQAAPVLDKLSLIAPDSQPVKDYLEKSKANNNPDFFDKKGDELLAASDLKNAIRFYGMALEYPSADQNIKKKLVDSTVKLVEFNFAKGIELSGQDLYKQAYDYLLEAFAQMKTLPIEKRTMIAIPKNDLNKYYDNMFFHGQKAKEKGSLGLAYFYYKMLYDLVPSYQGLLAEKKDVEDKILARSLKSIAVDSFISPSNEPELGLQASAKIMQKLQKELTNDVKVIERRSLDLLLREYELTVAGNAANNANTKDFKIHSADYLLFGEVLDSRTETSEQNSKRKDRVVVGTEKVRNIVWEDWKKEAEEAQKNRTEVPAEPPRYIDKPVYDYAEYDVSFHKKFSFLSISYRIDDSQGKIVHANTVQAHKDVQDEATSGIDLGAYKVPMKVAKLPTNIELSNQVRVEVIDKISAQIIDIFKDQDVKYISSAEKLESSNNLKEAVEMYANAIILMKKKKKDSDTLEDKVGKYLDVLASY